MPLDLPPQQVVCIAQAVYHEARGESEMGQRAVAHVILNRAKKRKLSPCQVLHQPGQFHIRLKKSYSGKDWQKAWQVANYPGKDPTGGATYFKHVKCRANWNLRLTTSVGSHNFYK